MVPEGQKCSSQPTRQQVNKRGGRRCAVNTTQNQCQAAADEKEKKVFQGSLQQQQPASQQPSCSQLIDASSSTRE